MLRLKVTFATDENLAAFDNAVWAATTFCDDEDAKLYGYVGFTAPYWRDTEVTFRGAKAEDIASSARPYVYHAYVNVVEQRESYSRRKNWDLRSKSTDLCLHVIVPPGMPPQRGYRSNTVRIGSYRIAAALQELPERFRGNPELDEVGRLKSADDTQSR